MAFKQGFYFVVFWPFPALLLRYIGGSDGLGLKIGLENGNISKFGNNIR